jgi:hypothetical protein
VGLDSRTRDKQCSPAGGSDTRILLQLTGCSPIRDTPVSRDYFGAVSHNDHEGNSLPSGSPTGTAEEALHSACGRDLADPAI